MTRRLTLAAVIAVFALAFIVAAAIERAPPDWRGPSPIATLRDDAGRPLWAIRLAPAAHEIAAEALDAAPAPAGKGYQLWLSAPQGPHSLGLLPAAGRKVIAETPDATARLGGSGELFVTREKARGSDTGLPTGPVLVRARF